MAAKKRNAGGQMTKARNKFEASNPQRYEGFSELLPGARNLSPGQVTRAMGWRDESESNSPMQGTLFEHPHMVDNPARWEDMKPNQQARVLSRAADFGVTPESMRRAYSTQLQRGLMRDPDHLSFYEATGHNAAGEDLPRERLQRSAKETNTPFHLVAATNAITSPQTSFVTTSKGRTYYPNAESAEAAVKYARAGMTGEEYEQTFKGKYPHQGYPKNLGRAIDVAAKVEGGAPIREAWNPGGRPGAGAGDKVRAFHNAWVDPHAPEGQFFVSDTHSGAAGMAPHLAGTKHEQAYLSIAGIHALHDHIARQVHHELGVSNVARGQSLQWNQEKVEAKDQGTSSSLHGVESVEAMRPTAQEVPRNVSPGQMGFF